MNEPTLGEEIRRRPVVVRFLPSAIVKLDEYAIKHTQPGRQRITRSDVVRAALAVAFRHSAELDKILTDMNGDT